MIAASMDGRQRWLDGLRGIAAAIVTCFHFTVGEMHIPYRRFTDTPAEENRHLIQLPPFRTVFAGTAMVTLFFVISGYSVPLAIIRLRGQNSNAECYRKLTSSALRRVFRLYLPVLVVCVISQVLFYAGAYSSWRFPETEGCPGALPWSSIWPHLKCLSLTIMSALGFVPLGGTQGLNSHLWTMLVELQGSFALYLTILALLSATSRARLTIIAVLTFLLFWFGFHESFCFFSGLLFAELDLIAHTSSEAFILPVTKKPSSRSSKLFIAAKLTLFSIGIYLLSMPLRVDHYEDYWYSSELTILPFWNYHIKRINSWYSVGAVLTVFAIRGLPVLKTALESSIPQFAGEISFSLYLIHQTFIRILRNPILEMVCRTLGGQGFAATRDDGYGSHVYYLSWVVATGVVGSLLVVTAALMTRTVDRRSIALAYRLEERLSGR